MNRSAQEYLKALFDFVKTAGDRLAAINAFVGALSALLLILGFPGSDSPQFKFAGRITLGAVTFFSLAWFVAFLLVPAWRRLPGRWLAAAAGLAGAITLALAIGAYSTAYEAQPVDRMVLGDQPTIQHITFDTAGTLMAVEFNSELRVRSLTSRREWHISWNGVGNDRLMLRSSPPQLSVIRLTSGEKLQASVWSWSLGGDVEKEDFQLGPNSNTDNQLTCTPQDWATDELRRVLAIAYKCSTSVVQQQAGGFIDVVPLVQGSVPSPAKRMQLPPPDMPEVPVGSSCQPKRVTFNQDPLRVIGLYDCSVNKTHEYHVKRWMPDDGAFASWTRVLEKMDGGTVLAVQNAPGGSSRISAQRDVNIELLQPASEQDWEPVSWLKHYADPVNGFAEENVALSPNGKWVADFEIYQDPTTEQKQRTIAIQEFGVWFAGFVRTAIFDDQYAALRQGQPV